MSEEYSDYFDFLGEDTGERSIASEFLKPLIEHIKTIHGLNLTGATIDLAYSIVHDDIQTLRAAQQRALGWKPAVVGGKSVAAKD